MQSTGISPCLLWVTPGTEMNELVIVDITVGMDGSLVLQCRVVT